MNTADYDQDFYAWITRNVQLLRAGSLSEIDADHIAEELGCLRASSRRPAHTVSPNSWIPVLFPTMTAAKPRPRLLVLTSIFRRWKGDLELSCVFELSRYLIRLSGGQDYGTKLS